jgi:hypothetical protein
LREKFRFAAKIQRLGRRERRARSKLAQFDHPVADVSVLGQMRGSNGFAAARHHLVEGAALGELRVKLPAKFARAAGACVEAMDDGGINVFHESGSSEAKKDSPGCEAESQYSAWADSFIVGRRLDDAFVLQGHGLHKAFVAGADSLLFRALGRAYMQNKRGDFRLHRTATLAVISGIIRRRFNFGDRCSGNR